VKGKGLIKILVCICLVLALAIPLMSGCGPATEYKIGLSQFGTHPAADAGREGFIDGMAEKGYIEGENVEYDFQNPEFDATVEQTIAQKFVNEKVDLIFTFATNISLQCINAAEGKDIPVVFCGITDPVGSGLISDWEHHPDENVTGVSDMISVADDVDLIVAIVPGVEKIGTLYNTSESNSVFLVEKLNEACDALGIEVVEAPVPSTADVLTAAQSLVGRVDAIWVGTDNTVVSGLEALIKVCEDNQIPLFPSDDPSIERGGIACWGFDYYDIGVQTGWMAAAILDGDGSAYNIPVEKGEIIFLSVNTAAAERMGVTIPQSLIDQAEIVYEE